MMEILKSCPFEEPIKKYEIENDKPMTNDECSMCHGTKYVLTAMGKSRCPKCCLYDTSHEKTNEEWFDGLSTEEKVNALLNLHKKVRQRMRTDIGGENSFYKGNYYREWLKQPHKRKDDD